MRKYNPSARTDQEGEYWTSGHGRRLKASIEGKKPEADTAVATCMDCHGGHGILAVKDSNSPVEPTHVAKTCARCHTDEKRMADRTYNGHPLGTKQYEQWMAGVHGQAMFKKGDRQHTDLQRLPWQPRCHAARCSTRLPMPAARAMVKSLACSPRHE